MKKQVKTIAKKSVSLKKETTAKKAVKTPKKEQRSVVPKYYKVDGKSHRIPKLVLGQHIDIIKMYFSVPVHVRKSWRQLILKATDKFTFGPLKGKQFQSLLKNSDDKLSMYYRNKFILATKNEEFAQKVATYFNPFRNLPVEIEVREEEVR